MQRLIQHLSWLVPIIAAVLMLLLGRGFHYQFNDFELTGPDGRQQAVEFPFSSGNWGLGNYSLKGSLVRSWFSPESWQIIPDDYLHALLINGQSVDLESFSGEERQDVERGFKVNLSDYLVLGNNQVEFIFEDYGGNIAMNMLPDKAGWHYGVLIFGWVAIAVWIFVVVATRMGVSRIHTILYFLVLLGSIIKVWYIFTYNPVDHIWSDPERHWVQGNDLVRIDLMTMTDPIGYQVYVAAIAKLTLQIPELVAFYACMLALFGAWIWYRFLRELQSDKTLALCGWVAFTFLPSWTAIYAYFMQETLFIPLLGAALWSTWRCRRKGDLRSFGLMVFIWTIAGLTRGIAIPLAALVSTWLWLVQDQKIPKAVFGSLILIAIMGPLTYRSYAVVGHFAPHGMGHLNVIYAQSGKQEIKIYTEHSGSRWGHGFGSPSTGEEPFQPFSDWKTRRSGQVRVNIDLNEGMRDWKKAIKAQDMGLKDYLWITKENFIFLFFGSSWPDNNTARVIDSLNVGMRFIWAPLFIVLLVGMGLHFRKFKGQWMLPSILGVWFLVQCIIPISVNEGRYRKPFEGIAIAQLVLWIAVAAGQTRPAAPGTPLTSYYQTSILWVRQTYDKIRKDKHKEHDEDNTQD